MLTEPFFHQFGETKASEAKTAANQAFQLLTNVPSIWIKIQTQTLPWARDAESESERCMVRSDSLQPHGLCRPWNSPGQNTGVGSRFLLQGIFSTQISSRRLFTSWATREPHRDAEWKQRMTQFCSWEGLQGLSYPVFLFCTLGSRGQNLLGVAPKTLV